MKLRMSKHHIGVFTLCILCGLLAVPCGASAADKLFTIYTARVMSQSYPWIAEEAGLFKKKYFGIPPGFVPPRAPAGGGPLFGDTQGTLGAAGSLSPALVGAHKK